MGWKGPKRKKRKEAGKKTRLESYPTEGQGVKPCCVVIAIGRNPIVRGDCVGRVTTRRGCGSCILRQASLDGGEWTTFTAGSWRRRNRRLLRRGAPRRAGVSRRALGAE